MIRIQGRSLRSRIAVAVLGGLVILFSFFGLLALRTLELSTEAALQERLRLAEISARSMDELVAHTTRQLGRAAEFVGSGESRSERQRASVVLDLLGEFDRIVKLDPDGRVLWRVPEGAGAAPVIELTEVQGALARGTTSIVTPGRGDPTTGLLAILVTPLDPRNRAAGFLAAELRASHADVSLLILPVTEGSVQTEIVDAEGYVLVQPGAGHADPPDEHVDILAPMVSSGRPGTTVHEVEGGAHHVVAYFPFQSLPGGVVVEQREDAAFVIPREMQRMLLVYGLAALLAASVAAWLHASSVVRPIERLTGAAARMAGGDLDSPIHVSRDDEIGQLARRFDEMRVKLRTSLDESSRWADELERRVADRTREVEQRNRELDALNRTRRQLLAKTISAQEEERKRLARELHDESAQTLAAVLMTLKTAENALPAASEGAREALDRSRSQLDVALREIRKAILDLRPSALDDLGLAPAVRWYADQRLGAAGIEMSMRTSGDERRATGAAATATFRVVQEAINNVARHSSARKAKIDLEFGPAAIVATVEDDGAGFDPDGLRQPQEDGRGLGLMGMRERAELFGGDVHLVSEVGKGTSVRVRIPYE